LEAALLAKELGLGLVLPRLVSNGRQDLRTGTKPVIVFDEKEKGGLPFGEIFDEALFSRVMGEQGVPIVSEAEAVTMGPEFTYPGAKFPMANYRASGARNIATGCALFASVGWTPHLAIKYEAYAHALLEALQPSPVLRGYVDKVKAVLTKASPDGAYDAMHLRYERDWWPMCDYWKAHPYVSPDPAHCGLWQPADLVSMLHRDFHLGQQPLYLAVDEEAVDDPSLLPLMRQSFPLGALTRDGILGTKLPREIGAQVDYHVCMDASVFVGNGYSTFSGFLVLQRQLEERRVLMRRAALGVGAWSTPPRRTLWYNGGDIPLSHFFPIMRTKWVFVTAAEPEGSEEEESVRAAVLSAFHKGGVAPTCLFAGNSTPFSRWMEAQGVEVEYYNASAIEGVRGEVLGKLDPATAGRVASFLSSGVSGGEASANKLLLFLGAPLSSAVRGTHHAILTSPYTVFLDRPQTFHLQTRLPACLSMVRDVPTRHAPPDRATFSSHMAYAGLTCLGHRLGDTAAALSVEADLFSKGATAAAHWVEVYSRVINRSFKGLITPLSPRWNAQHGAPLEPYALLATGRSGRAPCEAVFEPGSGGDGSAEAPWEHPSARALRTAAVSTAVSVATGEATGLWGTGEGTLAADWRGSCATLVRAGVVARESDLVIVREAAPLSMGEGGGGVGRGGTPGAPAGATPGLHPPSGAGQLGTGGTQGGKGDALPSPAASPLSPMAGISFAVRLRYSPDAAPANGMAPSYGKIVDTFFDKPHIGAAIRSALMTTLVTAGVSGSTGVLLLRRAFGVPVDDTATCNRLVVFTTGESFSVWPTGYHQEGDSSSSAEGGSSGRRRRKSGEADFLQGLEFFIVFPPITKPGSRQALADALPHIDGLVAKEGDRLLSALAMPLRLFAHEAGASSLLGGGSFAPIFTAEGLGGVVLHQLDDNGKRWEALLARLPLSRLALAGALAAALIVIFMCMCKSGFGYFGPRFLHKVARE
jgi:hypothetical protein